MRITTEHDVLQLLRQRVEAVGTQSEAARQLGVTPQYLCDVLFGRRGIGPKLLKGLGLERVESFKRVGK